MPIRSEADLIANQDKFEVFEQSLGDSVTFNCPVPQASASVNVLERLGVLSSEEAESLIEKISSGDKQAFDTEVTTLMTSGILSGKQGRPLLLTAFA